MQRIPVGRQWTALVDDADYEVLAQHQWYAHPSPYTIYARESPRCRCGSTARGLMHNMILGISGVDHADRDGLNNCRSNLRPASHRQNARNRSKGRFNRPLTSQYKGVTRLYGQGRWRVSIGSRENRKFIGSFPDEESAARAYDDAARATFGRYARLNFPQPGERSAMAPTCEPHL